MLTQISYDYKSFTLATGQTDYDIKTNIAELFDNIKVARRVLIKSNVTISFKFNNANLPAIELVISGGINESPFQTPKDFMEVVNIFISNTSGATATISVMLVWSLDMFPITLITLNFSINWSNVHL